MALGEIKATRADVAWFRPAFENGDLVLVVAGVLLDDDCVGTLGHGGAGENAHGLAGLERLVETVAGSGFTDQGKGGWQVRDILQANGECPF